MSSHAPLRQLELFLDLAPPSDVSPEAAPEVDAFATIAEPIVPAPPSAEKLSDHASELAGTLGLKKLSKTVSVHWNPRMRTTAGRAHYEALRIELNPGLIDLPGVDGRAEVDRTLRHELAHLVAHLRAGGRRIDPHGAEWRQACADLGIPGESRCHTLPFRGRKIRRKFLYHCLGCGVEVPRVRKFRRAVACYACCRKYTGGRYDEKFRLKMVRQKSR